MVKFQIYSENCVNLRTWIGIMRPPVVDMNQKRFSAIVLTVLCCAAFFLRAGAHGFISYAPAKKFIDVEVHASAGMSSVTQNYGDCFPQIQNLNVNSGFSGSLGAQCVFGLSDFLGLGTGLDFSINNYNMDLSVVSADKLSMSALFIDNRYYYATFPVFARFSFNVAHSVRWVVDGGLYYAYGVGGTQKQRIYRAEINGMDELVPQIQYIKTPYFHSRNTFVNSFNRGDIGLHLATGLHFGKHLSVGAKFQIGFKNAARKNGIVNPSIHNYTFHGLVGYRF